MNDIPNTKCCPFCGLNHRDYQCVDDLIAERNRLWTEVSRLRAALEAEQKNRHDVSLVAMGFQARDESPPPIKRCRTCLYLCSETCYRWPVPLDVPGERFEHPCGEWVDGRNLREVPGV